MSSTWSIYFLFVIGAPAGLHHAVLGRHIQQFLWLISCGGFGLGMCYDFLRLPSYIRSASASHERDEAGHGEDSGDRGSEEREVPVVSPGRMIGQVLFAFYFYGAFRVMFMGSGLPLAETAMYGVLGATLGTYLVGSVAGQTGPFVSTFCVLGLTHTLLTDARFTNRPTLMQPLFWSIVSATLWFTAYRRAESRGSRKLSGPVNFGLAQVAYTGKFSCARFSAAVVAAIGFYYVLQLRVVSNIWVPVSVKPMHQVQCVRLVDLDFDNSNYAVWLPSNERDIEIMLNTCFENEEDAAYWYETIIPYVRPEHLIGTHGYTSRGDAYRSLGLNEDATDDEIRLAYKRLARKWHPDKHAPGDELSSEQRHAKFIEIQQAYEVLLPKKSRRSK